MTMKTRISILILAVLAIGLVALPARAQVSDATLERELERTEELIQRAMELATAAANMQAMELLEQAVELQHQARNAYRNGRNEVAKISTAAARSIANKVIALLLNPEDRADRVEHELQRTDDMLAKARDHLGPGGPETARTLLEAAHRQQNQAWELFRAGNNRPALRMTHQVRELLNKIRLQLEEYDPERLEAAFKRTEELVGRAQEVAANSGDPRVTELAERAANFQHRAREFVANGQYLAAKHHLIQARKFAQRALHVARRGPSPQEFERMATQYEQMLQRVTDRLANAPNPAAQELLTESGEHFRLARELEQAGPESLQRAFAELNLALRLLNRAKELLG